MASFWILLTLIAASSAGFLVLPLGVSGGDEENLASFAVASTSDPSNFVSLDSGTLLWGLQAMNSKGFLKGVNGDELQLLDEKRPLQFLKEKIKAYLLSHPHLDHVAGLIVNSPNDKAGKTIIGFNSTISVIRDHYFNNKAWPDFGPNGIKTYNYSIAQENPTDYVDIPNTQLKFKAFPIWHSNPYLSTAFLIAEKSNDAHLLYFGDVGPDEVENLRTNDTNKMNLTRKVWHHVAPLVCEGKLTAILLECSYPNGRPDNLLFGHLTPKWMVVAMNDLQDELSQVCANQNPLEGFNVIVTHIKNVPGEKTRETIHDQLQALNTLKINYYLAIQGLPFSVSFHSLSVHTLSSMEWMQVNQWLTLVIFISVFGFLFCICNFLIMYCWRVRSKDTRDVRDYVDPQIEEEFKRLQHHRFSSDF